LLQSIRRALSYEPMRLLLLSLLFALALQSAFCVELIGVAKIDSTANSATVQWDTDVVAGARVHSTPAAEVQADRTPATHHTATISGLQPGVTYTLVIGTARVELATTKFTTPGTSTTTTQAEPKKATAPKANLLAKLFTPSPKQAPPTRAIWGYAASLPDHFARHGGDFGAKNADDYARMSWEFLQRAKAEGLPAKQDEDGVLRVFDPGTGTFAAYNRNGTTKTFFKPGGHGYFERQPGREVNLTTWK
jgi:pyocin large subunit-like protein